MQGLDVIDIYRNKENEIGDIVDSSKNKFSDLEKDINLSSTTMNDYIDDCNEDMKLFEKLGNDKNINEKIWIVLCYDKDSGLLVWDNWFAILNFDKQNWIINFDETIRVSSEYNGESYAEMIHTLWWDYDSFNIVDGDRIFSMKWNIRLDINTWDVIYSSEYIDADTQKKMKSVWISDLSVFYDIDFINSIIDKRWLVNQILSLDNNLESNADISFIKDKIEYLKWWKPVTLVMVPWENNTQASKYNNLDVLKNDYSVLYYQISSESEFKSILKELQVLKKYGLDIDNFYFQAHADKKHIFFSSKWNEDMDMISFDDWDEFNKYSGLFNWTNIIMNACESGKSWWNKKNIVDFMSSWLFSESQIIASPKFETYGVFNSNDFSKKWFVDNYTYYKQIDDSNAWVKLPLTDDEKYLIIR